MIIILLILTAASGFFSLSQISLFSLTNSKLKTYASEGDSRKKLIAKLLKKPKELLATLLICDIGANILIQNTAATIFGQYSGWVLKVGVPLCITLFVGEILPKTIALPNNAAISYRIAHVVVLLKRLLTPIRVVLTFIAECLSNVFFFFLRPEKEISVEELQQVLKRSESKGILSVDESYLLEGYLDLLETTLKERSRPREEILYYSLDAPLSKLMYFFIEKQCARVPVCRGDLQNIVGILSARDFFVHRPHIQRAEDCLLFLKKPFFVPETISAKSLLKQFLVSNEKMGIVVDEYGSVSGLITQEDLYEVVTGEIADTREKMRYTRVGDEVIITSGKFELSEFEALFDVALPSENNMVTIGGWLTEQIGDIPKSGAKFYWDHFLFHVLAADPNRVRRVYIRRLTKDRGEHILNTGTKR